MATKKKPAKAGPPITAAQGAKIIELFTKISGQLERLTRKAAA